MQKTNHQPEYLLRELGAHGLDPQVKERMRVQLSSYADFHTAGQQRASVRNVFGFLGTVRWYAPTAALLMFALLAGGTANASERSLPGEKLYTVKIRVAEPLQIALATTPEKKAEVHASFAERRLTEAAKLAVAETLTSETAGFLEQEFSQHIDGSLAAADALMAEGKADASLEVRSDLEARLVAHADILDLVEDHLEDSNAPVRDATETVLATVKLRQEVVSETRVALERELADDVTPTQTLALVTKATEAVSPVAQTAVFDAVTEHVVEADEALTMAKEALDGGGEDTSRAYRKALEAGRASTVVSTLLENTDILIAVGADVAATTTATTTVPVATTTETVTPAQQ